MKFLKRIQTSLHRKKYRFITKNIYIEQVIEFKFAEFQLSFFQHIFYFLKWMSKDYRDSGAKRNSGSNPNKPHPKLQKLKN